MHNFLNVLAGTRANVRASFCLSGFTCIHFMMSHTDKGIAMNQFEMQILNGALDQVDSDADSINLATMIIRLTKQENSDHVLDHLDAQLLALLINHERRTSEHPSFSNIYSLVASHNLDELTQLPGWKEFAVQCSGRLRNSCLHFLEMRLLPFKCLRAA